MLQKRKLIAKTAGALVVILALSDLSAEPDSISSDDWAPLQKSSAVTMEDGSMNVNGKEVPLRTLVFSKSKSSFNDAVGLPVPGDLMEYSVISFQVKLELPSGAPDNFIVTFFNEKGWYLKNDVNSLVTKFLDHANEVAPGVYEFFWDARQKFEAYEMGDARHLVLIYPTSQIPDGETVKVSVSAVSFQK